MCYHAPTLLGARALIWKDKGNIHIVYDCIQIVTVSAVGECWNEAKRFRRMRIMKLSGMKISAVGECGE
jgi:hypothetical protein